MQEDAPPKKFNVSTFKAAMGAATRIKKWLSARKTKITNIRELDEGIRDIASTKCWRECSLTTFKGYLSKWWWPGAVLAGLHEDWTKILKLTSFQLNVIASSIQDREKWERRHRREMFPGSILVPLCTWVKEETNVLEFQLGCSIFEHKGRVLKQECGVLKKYNQVLRNVTTAIDYKHRAGQHSRGTKKSDDLRYDPEEDDFFGKLMTFGVLKKYDEQYSLDKGII